MVNQLADFLDRLYRYCDGLIEIRPLPGGKQAYFKPSNVDGIRQYFTRWPKKNIYFGIGTRNGLGGKKENVTDVPAVWADVDFKDISRQKLFDRLKSFLCKPSMIVKSGNGVHFYFILSQPAGPEDFARVVDVNKRIALCLNGDLNATDAARVLRPPETYNRKYKPPRLVELTLIDRFEYDLQFFEDELPQPDKKPIHPTNTGAGISTNRPGWLIDALKGVSAGQRNSTGAKIAGYFVNKLHTDDVLTIIEAWNSHNKPPLPEADIEKIVRSVGRYRNLKHAKKKKARITIHSF